MEKHTLLSLLAFYLVSGVFSSAIHSPKNIVSGPVNTAARNGETNVRLNCTVVMDHSDAMEWRFYPQDFPTGYRIYSTFDETIHFPDEFDIDRRGPNNSSGHQDIDLVVKELTGDLSVRYECVVLLAGYRVPADLVSLSPVTCSPSEVYINGSEEVDLSCNVEYHGYLPPLLQWVDSNGDNITTEIITDSNTVNATARFTPSSSSVLSCLLYFYDEEGGAPEYTDSCTTRIVIQGQTTMPGYDTTAAVFTTAASSDSCYDISGRWRDPVSGAQLILFQEPNAIISGTYSDGPDSGWFELQGHRAHTQDTFGFTVIGQYGLYSTSFTGECQSCGPDILFTKSITYVKDENVCKNNKVDEKQVITEHSFHREQ